MDKMEFKKLIRECIREVLVENLSADVSTKGVNRFEDPLYVEYHSQRQGEKPFMMGGTKFEYVNATYPNGKIDVGVYSFAEDLVYSYNSFRKRHNIQESDNKNKKWKKDLDEMTGTSAVQGFYGKNWCDPDPERKRMKSIAAKSVGGDVTK